MCYFQESVQSSRYAYDQLIAAQCPVNDSLLMIKAAHLNLLLARIGTVSLPPTCAAVQLHCGGIPLRSLLRHKCLFVPPKEAPQKRQNTTATARCATAVLETQWQGLPLSPPSLPLPLRAIRGSGADYVTSGPSAAQTQQRQLLSHSR